MLEEARVWRLAELDMGILLGAIAEQNEVLTFSFIILFVFFLLAAFSYLSYRLQYQQRALCPYTNKPMWRGEDIPLDSVRQVMRFLYYDIHNYDNRVFPMRRAMVCRDTGRIFPYCVNWLGFSHVDWTFLRKRYPGIYVSWGSLSFEKQQEIKARHNSLEGFQTEDSSPNPSPRDIEEAYIFLKPGPLYVDIETNVLLGWKCVPDTMFEVLIVQQPLKPQEGAKDRIIGKRKI